MQPPIAFLIKICNYIFAPLGISFLNAKKKVGFSNIKYGAPTLLPLYLLKFYYTRPVHMLKRYHRQRLRNKKNIILYPDKRGNLGP